MTFQATRSLLEEGRACVASVDGAFPPRSTLYFSRLVFRIPKVYQLAFQLVFVFFMHMSHTENERNNLNSKKACPLVGASRIHNPRGQVVSDTSNP